MTRKERLKVLRESLRSWEDQLGEVHTLSPCDPRKKQHVENAKLWRGIIEEDPELLDLLYEIDDFEEIFFQDAS
jgi:hypothetical protein